MPHLVLCRCFVPTVFRKSGVLPEEEVLAVVVNAGQVSGGCKGLLQGAWASFRARCPSVQARGVCTACCFLLLCRR